MKNTEPFSINQGDTFNRVSHRVSDTSNKIKHLHCDRVKPHVCTVSLCLSPYRGDTDTTRTQTRHEGSHEKKEGTRGNIITYSVGCKRVKGVHPGFVSAHSRGDDTDRRTDNYTNVWCGLRSHFVGLGRHSLELENHPFETRKIPVLGTEYGFSNHFPSLLLSNASELNGIIGYGLLTLYQEPTLSAGLPVISKARALTPRPSRRPAVSPRATIDKCGMYCKKYTSILTEYFGDTGGKVHQ
jgi:hypothetical protein